MAKFGTPFDATTVEPAEPLEVLPPGNYLAQIVNSEMRVTKNGLGEYLWLEMDVLEGPYQGRKLFDRLNLINENTQTVEIARSALSAICHATGRMKVQDSEQLHLVPFIAVVRLRPAKNGYGESNTVRYLPIDRTAQAALPQPAGNAPSQPAKTAAAKARPATAMPTSPPWKKHST